MKPFIIGLTAIALLSLSACDKPAPNNLPDGPTTVPTPKSSIGKGVGSSGDDRIQSEPAEPRDEGIQNAPVKPNGDSTIIIPPPVADMPPEVVPDKTH